jgi:hypothetical protein
VELQEWVLTVIVSVQLVVIAIGVWKLYTLEVRLFKDQRRLFELMNLGQKKAYSGKSPKYQEYPGLKVFQDIVRDSGGWPTTTEDFQPTYPFSPADHHRTPQL